MIYRADRAEGQGKVEGYYVVTKLKVEGYLVTTKLVDESIHWITDGIYPYSGLVPKFTEIKPETLEVFLFGEWRLVSELEKKYVLVEKQPIDDLKSYEDVSRKPVVKKVDLSTIINEIKELAKGKQ